MSDIRILITCLVFDRPASISRLLASLRKRSNIVATEVEVDLLVSVDFSSKQSLVISQIAGFEWPFGSFEIVAHEKNIGLVNNVYFCGDRVADYDLLVMLEDDLVVAPNFIDYALATYEFYRNSQSIAGFSLYSPRFNETSLQSFFPLDFADAFLIQLPCSWGQFWTRDQWRKFRDWQTDDNLYQIPHMPSNMARWSNKSWKRVFAQYLISENLYLVYPLNSYTTNFGENGVHVTSTNIFQVPLSFKSGMFRFLDENNCPKYDAWLDLNPDFIKKINPRLGDIDFEVNGSLDKQCSKNMYQLSFIKGKDVAFSWEASTEPQMSSVLLDISGDGLFLSRHFTISSSFQIICRYPRTTLKRALLPIFRRLLVMIKNLSCR